MWIRTGLAVWPSAVSTTSTSPIPARPRGTSTVTSSHPGKWPDAPKSTGAARIGRTDCVPSACAAITRTASVCRSRLAWAAVPVSTVPDAVPMTAKLVAGEGPRHVHTTELSLVVPPTVPLHTGAVVPLVPAVVTFCAFPDGSRICCPRGYTVEGCHAGYE